MNYMFLFGVLFLLYSCERPGFIKKVAPPELISRSYTVQEFVRNKAEIIWVIDNSGSMDTYQDAIIQNMQIFIDSFVQNVQGADWRMALLSTDKSESPYIGFLPTDYLDSSSPNPVLHFNHAIKRLGTNGDAVSEQVFFPIQSALILHQDFLRENSKLFIILVSDEPEQGRGSVNDFLDFLYALKDPESISTYGVFEMSEQGCGMTPFFGSRYEEFILRTNGLTFPICSGDYGVGLATFGSDIAQKTSVSKIQLEAAPVADTIEVVYQGNRLPKGRVENGGYWNYNSVDNAIHFHNLGFLQGFDLEKVRVNYEKARLLEE